MSDIELFNKLLKDPNIYRDSVIVSIMLNDEHAFVKSASIASDIGQGIKDWLLKLYETVSSKIHIGSASDVINFITPALLFHVIGGIPGFLISVLFELSGYKITDAFNYLKNIVSGPISEGKQFTEQDIKNAATQAVESSKSAIPSMSEILSGAGAILGGGLSESTASASEQDAVMFKMAYIDLRNYLIETDQLEKIAAGGIFGSILTFLKSFGPGGALRAWKSSPAGRSLLIKIMMFVLRILVAKAGLLAGAAAIGGIGSAIKGGPSSSDKNEEKGRTRSKTIGPSSSVAEPSGAFREVKDESFANQESKVKARSENEFKYELYNLLTTVYDVPEISLQQFRNNPNINNFAHYAYEYKYDDGIVYMAAISKIGSESVNLKRNKDVANYMMSKLNIK